MERRCGIATPAIERHYKGKRAELCAPKTVLGCDAGRRRMGQPSGVGQVLEGVHRDYCAAPEKLEVLLQITAALGLPKGDERTLVLELLQSQPLQGRFFS